MNHHLTTAGINEARAAIVAKFDAALAAGDFARALLVIAGELDSQIMVLGARAKIAPRRYVSAAARGLAAAQTVRAELLKRWEAGHAASTQAADAA